MQFGRRFRSPCPAPVSAAQLFPFPPRSDLEGGDVFFVEGADFRAACWRLEMVTLLFFPFPLEEDSAGLPGAGFRLVLPPGPVL